MMIVYFGTMEYEDLKNEYFDWLETSEEPLNMTEWAREYKCITIKV
jgi:hypothetical protein